ncbi:hypothetical protein HY484_01460 [Candidatus Woesearchaeota archaeon]|nr:hypothetical protein [Candidatus Woesearchaeota archaeon]
MVKKKKSVKQKTSSKTAKKTRVKKLLPAQATKILSTVKQQIKQKIPERVEVHFVKKSLGKAPEEHHFVLHDGRKLKSLYELVDELETMSEDAFKDYVSEFKNDFANWTKDIFHAPELADELFKIKNKFDTQKAVMKHLLRDMQTLVQEAVHQTTAQAHHTNKDKKEHDKLLHKHMGKAGRCFIA